MFKKDGKSQPARITPSKSMLSQIQSRIAQSRMKSRLALSRNTPDKYGDDRFLYKSMSKKDQKKIEPIAQTYSLPVPKIKLLVLNKKPKESKTRTSEFLDSEETTFDDFKEYRLFNEPQISPKKYNQITTPKPIQIENKSQSKIEPDENFFLSKTHSFAYDDSYLPGKEETIYLKESCSYEPENDYYLTKQESTYLKQESEFEKNDDDNFEEDSFIKVVKSPSFLSGKSSFVSFIPYNESPRKEIKFLKTKPQQQQQPNLLTKNHHISHIQLNKLKIYDDPLPNKLEEESYMFNESLGEEDSFFKQDSFDKDDSFIKVVKSPSFLSGQSSLYSLISLGNKPKNKFSISQANSNKFDQYLKKYYHFNNSKNSNKR